MSERPALPFKLRVLRLGFRALRGLSQDLAFRGAERLFCTPKRHRVPEAEQAVARKGHSFELRTKSRVNAASELARTDRHIRIRRRAQRISVGVH